MFRRNRRTFRHRRSGKRVETFWVRNSGLLTANQVVPKSQVVLFDRLQYNEGLDLRAEASELKLLTIWLNYDVIFTPQAGLGTSLSAALFFGIRLDDRDSVVKQSAFSLAQDARADWLDCWYDVTQFFVAGASAYSQGTLGIGNDPGTQHRHTKTKRLMRAQDLMLFSVGVFGTNGGTLPSTWSLAADWQMSALLVRP